jgi:hypothetical protein
MSASADGFALEATGSQPQGERFTAATCSKFNTRWRRTDFIF